MERVLLDAIADLLSSMMTDYSGLSLCRHGFARGIGSFALLVFVLSLAACGGSGGGSSSPQPSSHVFSLDANPSRAELKAARQAYRKGAIIEAVGGDIDKLNGWFGINIPHAPTVECSGVAPCTGSGATLGNPQAVAFRATPGGALHSFQGYASGVTRTRSGSAKPPQWHPQLLKWEQNESTLGTQLSGDEPDPSGWTEIQSFQATAVDSSNNQVEDNISIYRLNSINSQYAWYLVLRQPWDRPNFYNTNCAKGFHKCGWFLKNRNMLVLPVPFNIWEYEPTGTITSSTAGFTAGGALGKNTNGNASFSESWSQPSVTTTDQSDLPQAAEWEEDISLSSIKPPPVSSGSFYSIDATIFQTPLEDTSFSAPILRYNITFAYYELFWDWSYLTEGFSINLPQVNAPVLSVSPTTVDMSDTTGATRILNLSAEIPDSSSGLAWQIINTPPSWLSVSPTSGNGYSNQATTPITLRLEPSAVVGDTTTLQFNTNPSNAAPSVAKGPLVVTVNVVSPYAGVLVTGGSSDGATILQSAEVYDPSTSSFLPVNGEMIRPRMYHTETPLSDGRVLIAGGVSTNDQATDTAEVFDPTSYAFTSTANDMSVARAQGIATLLHNGQVLIAGGWNNSGDTDEADLFNPATNSFSPTGSMTVAREQATATLLPSGSVLIAGGLSNSTALASAEIYNPSTGKFTAVGNMTVARYGHAAALLADGRVLITGGFSGSGADSKILSSAELFNPATQKFTPTIGSMSVSRASHTATLLPSGKVLITGGTTTGGGESTNTAELFDSDTESFRPTGSMSGARQLQTATLMMIGPQAGQVLIVGGISGATDWPVATAELYKPAAGTFSSVGNMSTPRAWAGAGEFQ